ncbi:hypothetical protein ACWGKX_35330, partial [Streptomyces tricolor]
MSRNRSTPRSRTWLRVLVLLLALWVPGAHVPAQAVPDPVVAAETAAPGGRAAAPRPARRARPHSAARAPPAARARAAPP